MVEISSVCWDSLRTFRLFPYPFQHSCDIFVNFALDLDRKCADWLQVATFSCRCQAPAEALQWPRCYFLINMNCRCVLPQRISKIIIVMAEQVIVKKSNGMGVAGFVLALLGVIFIWVPALNWILWLLGLIFSIIGVCRAPRGLAIAGLVLSAIYLIILFVVIGALFAAASAL